MSVRGRKRRLKRSTEFTIPHLSPEQRYSMRVQSMILGIAEHDWHAVADCAMDIRELVAAHPELRRHEQRLWSKM